MKNILAKMLVPATDSGNLSIGRIMLLACFALSMWKWAYGKEIVGTQLTVLLALLGYVFGTKVLAGVSTLRSGKDRQPKPDPDAKGD